MAYLGLLITVLGFGISLLSLGVTQSVNARMAMAVVGMAVSLAGIFGVINRAYLKDAIWRK